MLKQNALPKRLVSVLRRIVQGRKVLLKIVKTSLETLVTINLTNLKDYQCVRQGVNAALRENATGGAHLVVSFSELIISSTCSISLCL